MPGSIIHSADFNSDLKMLPQRYVEDVEASKEVSHGALESFDGDIDR
jgi:hypothetical protein